MGKAAKAHRAKVAKRNANIKVQEKRMQKVWQEAFEEQMNVMKEKFASMSGETMSGLTENIDILDEDSKNELKQMYEENFKDININLETSDENDSDIVKDLKNLKEKIKGEFSNEEEIENTEKDFDKLLELIKNGEKEESEEEPEPTKPVSGE